MLIAGIFSIAKRRKKQKCASIDEWIKRMWNIYVVEYYSALKMNEILVNAAM